MLEASAQREERERRFQAAMTANLMNCLVRDRVTVEDLLGLPARPTAGKGPDQMSGQERENYAARLAATAGKKKRGKQARRTAAEVQAEDAARLARGCGAGSDAVAGEVSGRDV